MQFFQRRGTQIFRKPEWVTRWENSTLLLQGGFFCVGGVAFGFAGGGAAFCVCEEKMTRKDSLATAAKAVVVVSTVVGAGGVGGFLTAAALRYAYVSVPASFSLCAHDLYSLNRK
jgi:hypothetical protein